MADDQGASQTESTSLREAMHLAGWGPRDLTRAVNAWLSTRGRSSERVDPTAAYPWIRSNYCPHGGIPDVVATVLSERLGEYVAADQLWPGHSRAENATRRVALATGGKFDEIARSLSQLIAGARPAPISGPDLAAAAINGLRGEVEHQSVRRSRDRVQQAQAELIAAHVVALRQLDDRQGGGALSLRYVSRELESVLDLLRSASYEPDVGCVLLTAVADLAQLTGWMQFDAGEAAVAKRYLLLAIGVARAARDDGRAINNAGMLSYMAAATGAGREAVGIANAAAAVPTSSRLLQARIAGRQATAHAAVGDLGSFRMASERARELLISAPEDHTSPYLYYVTDDQLSAEAGFSLLQLSRRTEIFQRSLLREASDLLEPRARLAHEPGYTRSAVLHGCQLAEVRLMLRDLDGAVEAAKGAVARLPEVQSGRCQSMLRVLRGEFAQRKRSVVVADFLPELDHVLAHG